MAEGEDPLSDWRKTQPIRLAAADWMKGDTQRSVSNRNQTLPLLTKIAPSRKFCQSVFLRAIYGIFYKFCYEFFLFIFRLEFKNGESEKRQSKGTDEKDRRAAAQTTKQVNKTMTNYEQYLPALNWPGGENYITAKNLYRKYREFFVKAG